MQIINFFHLNLFHVDFYIWKIIKTKSLSHLSKKEYRDHEYFHVRIKIKI
jgi:hypothetical protein